MIVLKCWPPHDDALPAYHSHLVITFGAPLSDKMRAKGIEQEELLGLMDGDSTFLVIVTVF